MFDPSNKTKTQSTSRRFELRLKRAAATERPGPAWGRRGAVAWRPPWRGYSSAASRPSLPPKQFGSFLAKPEQLRRNSLSANISLAASCCAGDRHKPFVVVFGGASVDPRGLVSSGTCWLMLDVFATWDLLLFLPTLHHRITESQNGRGWKGPVWVI